MNTQKTIINYNEYGYVKFDIKKIIDKKKLSCKQISKITGLDYKVVKRYMNNDVERMDRDVLAKLCYILDCDTSDFISYKKPKK